MLTKNLYVYDNWVELTNQVASERALLWRIAVGVPTLVLVMVLIVKALPLPGAATIVLIQAVSFCLFYAVVVWYALRHRPDGVKAALGMYLGSVSISVIAGSLALGHLEVPFRSDLSVPWTVPIGIVLFPLNWLLLRTIATEHPREFEMLGLRFPRSRWFLAFGILGGSLLSVHFFFTGALAELFTPGWKPWPVMFWQLSLIVGLRSLGEELFFRGLIFHQLYRIRQGDFWVVSGVVALGNVLPYIGIGWQGDPMLLAVFLFYVIALAVVNGLLYRISDSILPGVVSSVIFYFLVILH